MSDLYMAVQDKVDGQLICGNCGGVMRSPKILSANGDAQLVECPHCWKLNKVKKNEY